MSPYVYAYRGTVQDDERELLFTVDAARQYAIDLLHASNVANQQTTEPIAQSSKDYRGPAEGRLSRFFRTVGRHPWDPGAPNEIPARPRPEGTE